MHTVQAKESIEEALERNRYYGGAEEAQPGGLGTVQGFGESFRSAVHELFQACNGNTAPHASSLFAHLFCGLLVTEDKPTEAQVQSTEESRDVYQRAEAFGPPRDKDG